MPDDLVEKVARIIANAMGDNFADAFKNKTRWIAKRGESGGRFRDINEPMQCDYLAAAEAAIEASGLTQLTAERDALAAQCEALAGALDKLVGEELGGDSRVPSFRDETDFYRPVISWAMRRRARAALAAYKGDAG